MTTIEKSIDVNVPASKSYDVWTRFEIFPEFMEDVEEVEQKDDRHLHWRAKILGKTEEWDAEITEQIPDKRIAWRSENGAQNSGVVTFHRLSDDTSRVMLQLEYEPKRLIEKVGDLLGVAARHVERDLENFKEFVETRGRGLEGWSGEIPARPDSDQRPGRVRG